MCDWHDEIEKAITAFLTVAELAGEPITRSEIEIEYLPAPHRAQYAFQSDGALRVLGRRRVA